MTKSIALLYKMLHKILNIENTLKETLRLEVLSNKENKTNKEVKKYFLLLVEI